MAHSLPSCDSSIDDRVVSRAIADAFCAEMEYAMVEVWVEEDVDPDVLGKSNRIGVPCFGNFLGFFPLSSTSRT